MTRISNALLVVIVAVALTLGDAHAATFRQCPKIGTNQAEVVLSVRAVGVLDGDTVDVLLTSETSKLLPYRVRLAEIDAPEKDQPFGNMSSTTLGDLVNGKTIELRYSECDRYHRIIGRLFVADRYVSDEMLRLGAAWFNPQYSNSADLYETENAARDAKRGLWALPTQQIVEPWVWRKLSAVERRVIRE